MAQHKTSPTEAFRVATASIILSVAAQILIIMAGITASIAIRQGTFKDSDLWKILLISTTPYIVLALEKMLRATIGTQKIFPSLTTTKNHTIKPISPTKTKDYHLIPVNTQTEETLDGVPISDVIEFINQIPVRGITYDEWVREGYTFSSSRKCTYPTFKKLIGILEKGGILVGRRHRVSGHLVTTDPEIIKHKLKIYQLLGY